MEREAAVPAGSLKFAVNHMDKEKAFWRNILWSYEAKLKLYGHNDQRYRGTLPL